MFALGKNEQGESSQKLKRRNNFFFERARKSGERERERERERGLEKLLIWLSLLSLIFAFFAVVARQELTQRENFFELFPLPCGCFISFYPKILFVHIYPHIYVTHHRSARELSSRPSLLFESALISIGFFSEI